MPLIIKTVDGIDTFVVVCALMKSIHSIIVYCQHVCTPNLSISIRNVTCHKTVNLGYNAD